MTDDRPNQRPRRRRAKPGKVPAGRRLGRVRWFSAERGYGFVVDDEHPGVDLFVHHESVQLDGFRNLAEGQRVLFVVEDTERGPAAFDVLPIVDEG